MVNVNQLIELINTFPKIKYPDKIIKVLLNHGFKFIGYKNKLNKTENLIIDHDNNHNIVMVMKHFSNTFFTTSTLEFDYAHFNYNMLALKSTETLDLKDLFVYNTLSKDSQEFLIAFNKAINNEGYFYGDYPTSGFCWGKSQFAFSKFPEKKKDYVCRLYQRDNHLVVRLFLKNVNNYFHYRIISRLY